MEQKGTTARVSAFSRAYHYENNEIRIFDDSVAKKLLSKEEYDSIAAQMSNGIAYFNPEFKGSKEAGLRWIVDHVLSPTPLGRAAFAENSLELAVRYGATQYMICAAGFDTFAYRRPEWAEQLKIFELDYPTTSREKQERLKNAGITDTDQVSFVEVDFSQHNWVDTLKQLREYDSSQVTFVSFLGMIYYLSKEDFERFLDIISQLIPENSSIVFDYPDKLYFRQQTKHAALAKASNEDMQASYSYKEMTQLLEKYHFQIFEHLNQEDMTEQYFSAYNSANPHHIMEAQANVYYCLAVKKSL